MATLPRVSEGIAKRIAMLSLEDEERQNVNARLLQSPVRKAFTESLITQTAAAVSVPVQPYTEKVVQSPSMQPDFVTMTRADNVVSDSNEPDSVKVDHNYSIKPDLKIGTPTDNNASVSSQPYTENVLQRRFVKPQLVTAQTQTERRIFVKIRSYTDLYEKENPLAKQENTLLILEKPRTHSITEHQGQIQLNQPNRGEGSQSVSDHKRIMTLGIAQLNIDIFEKMEKNKTDGQNKGKKNTKTNFKNSEMHKLNDATVNGDEEVAFSKFPIPKKEKTAENAKIGKVEIEPTIKSFPRTFSKGNSSKEIEVPKADHLNKIIKDKDEKEKKESQETAKRVNFVNTVNDNKASKSGVYVRISCYGDEDYDKLEIRKKKQLKKETNNNASIMKTENMRKTSLQNNHKNLLNQESEKNKSEKPRITSSEIKHPDTFLSSDINVFERKANTLPNVKIHNDKSEIKGTNFIYKAGTPSAEETWEWDKLKFMEDDSNDKSKPNKLNTETKNEDKGRNNDKINNQKQTKRIDNSKKLSIENRNAQLSNNWQAVEDVTTKVNKNTDKGNAKTDFMAARNTLEKNLVLRSYPPVSEAFKPVKKSEEMKSHDNDIIESMHSTLPNPPKSPRDNYHEKTKVHSKAYSRMKLRKNSRPSLVLTDEQKEQVQVLADQINSIDTYTESPLEEPKRSIKQSQSPSVGGQKVSEAPKIPMAKQLLEDIKNYRRQKSTEENAPKPPPPEPEVDYETDDEAFFSMDDYTLEKGNNKRSRKAKSENKHSVGNGAPIGIKYTQNGTVPVKQ